MSNDKCTNPPSPAHTCEGRPDLGCAGCAAFGREAVDAIDAALRKPSPSEKYVVTLEEDQDPHDDRLRLRVIRDGVVQREEVDRGEPEDQSFYRDWAWVPDALREAYAFGLADAGQPMRQPRTATHPALLDLFFEVEQHIKKNSTLEMGGRKFKTPSIAKLADALAYARECTRDE